MATIIRPLGYGFGIAVGTFFGLVVLGGSSVGVGLTGAIAAFVVMAVLKFFER